MTFLSSAQNGEDVILWRALHDVVAGRYIDVGAADPTDDSVTHAFYERGWRGINIEPEPELYARLAAARPEDINLQVGLAAEPGEAVFSLVGHRSGLSTFNADVANTHSEAGFKLRRIKIPLRTLAKVCEEHIRGPVQFLKIDVEGSEQTVIQGADFTRYRPWVVLVEATFPNSDRPTHASWEPLLSRAGYRFTLFDGLNRFYVASEHWDRLHSTLSYSACVRDGYTTLREDAAKRRVTDLERLLLERESEAARHVGQLRADIADLNRRLADSERRAAQCDLEVSERDHTIACLRDSADELSAELRAWDRHATALEARSVALEAEVSAAERHITALHASTSWRVTAPLREAKSTWERFARPSRDRAAARRDPES